MGFNGYGTKGNVLITAGELEIGDRIIVAMKGKDSFEKWTYIIDIVRNETLTKVTLRDGSKRIFENDKPKRVMKVK